VSEREGQVADVLAGIRVLDFGRYIAGPYCAALLADLGADVIRIERRDGGEDRWVAPVGADGVGAMYLVMNRNKRAMTLDPGKLYSSQRGPAASVPTQMGRPRWARGWWGGWWRAEGLCPRTGFMSPIRQPWGIARSYGHPPSALRRSSPWDFHHWCRIAMSVPTEKCRTPMSRKYFA
jgi:hypothetical protein